MKLFYRGGTLAAAGGHIALGGVQAGIVSLDFDSDANSGQLGYEGVDRFGDIKLSSQ